MVRPSNHRLRNAKYGKVPSVNGTLARVPKGNGTFLFTTNGSTANNGGPSKFGMFPNVGTSLGFRNRFSTLSMNYLTTPASRTRPVTGSQRLRLAPIPSGSSVSFTFGATDDYGIQRLRPDGTPFPGGVEEVPNSACTDSFLALYDGLLNNGEIETALLRQAFGIGNLGEMNATESSNIPIVIQILQSGATGSSPDEHPYFIYTVYDNDPNATYTINVKQKASTAPGAADIFDENYTFQPYLTTLEQYGVDFTHQLSPLIHRPPVGVLGSYEGAFDMTNPTWLDPANNTGINYYSTSAGTGVGSSQNYYMPATFGNNTGGVLTVQPLVITVTKN